MNQKGFFHTLLEKNKASPALQKVREELLRYVLLAFSVLGGPAAIIASFEAVSQGRPGLSLIYAGVYLPVLGITLFPKILSPKGKAYLLLVCIHLLGFLTLLYYGFNGAGIHILLTLPVLATTLRGGRIGLISVFISLILISISGWLFSSGLVVLDPVMLDINNAGVAWATASATFLMLSLVMVVTSSFVIRQLQKSLTSLNSKQALIDEGEEKYRLLTENTIDVIWQMDLSLNFTYVNPAVEAMSGYTQEEWIGSNLSQHTTWKSYYQMARQALGAIKNYKTFNYVTIEATMLKKDRTEFPVEIVGRLLLDENGLPYALHGSTRDITERIKSQERIRRLLKEQTAINTLTMDLGEIHDLEMIYQSTYKHVRDLMDADAFSVSFYDRESHMIRAGFVVADGETLNTREFPPIPLEPEGNGNQSQVIRSGNPRYVPDLYAVLQKTDSKYYFDKEGKLLNFDQVAEEEVVRSAILAPMKNKGEVIGVMQAQSYRQDGYTQEDLDLLAGLANVAAIAIQNARLLVETQQRMERMQSLRNIDRAITGLVDLNIVLSVVLDQVVSQLGVDAAAVFLFDPSLKRLEYTAGTGFTVPISRTITCQLGQGLCGQVAIQREVFYVQDLATNPLVQDSPEMSYYRPYKAYCGIPLVTKGQLVGVMEALSVNEMHSEEDWVEFLETLGGQAAIAIENASMFDHLQSSNMELVTAYDGTIEGWAKALELRHTESTGHSSRVVNLALKTARAMGISGRELVNIRRGALLHDIGMLGIDVRLLEKPGSLTEEEWEIVKTHPKIAYDLLSPIQYLRGALEIPYAHHERWDGTGYPRGLSGAGIPLAARIFAVVDVWDAMLSDKPYRKARSEVEAEAYLREASGTHFDPQVVEVFLRVV